MAVWPPPAVADRVASLDRPEMRDIRWTTRQQWHVTLRFLGDVADPERSDLDAALAAVAASAAPAPVTVGPATRILGQALLILPAGGLDRLAAGVHAATGAGERPFVGHMTLARARRKARVPARLGGSPLEAAWTATEMVLARSRLDAAGAVYEPVARYRLGG